MFRTQATQGPFELLSERGRVPDLLRAHQVGTQVQHHRGLHRSAMQPVAPLRVRQTHPVGARKMKVAGLHHEETGVGPQPQPGGVQRGAIAPMAVAEHQPSHPTPGHRHAVLVNHSAQEPRRQAQGSLEAQMLPAGSDRLWRQHPGWEVVR